MSNSPSSTTRVRVLSGDAPGAQRLHAPAPGLVVLLRGEVARAFGQLLLRDVAHVQDGWVCRRVGVHHPACPQPGAIPAQHQGLFRCLDHFGMYGWERQPVSQAVHQGCVGAQAALEPDTPRPGSAARSRAPRPVLRPVVRPVSAVARGVSAGLPIRAVSSSLPSL